MFFQLDNYKAFQFSEQERNDTKIGSYLKTVILCTSRDLLLESILKSLKTVLRWEGKRLSFDSTSGSNEFFMLCVNALSKTSSTKTYLSYNTST